MINSVCQCKECKKRTVGCHATCESYIQWKKEHDAHKAAARKKQYIENLGR